jgi:hypothetical protein
MSSNVSIKFFGVLAITYVHEFVHVKNLAAAFNQNIGGWNTAKVSEMYSLFSSKTALNADISKWNAVSVSPNTDMYVLSRFFEVIVTSSLPPGRPPP